MAYKTAELKEQALELISSRPVIYHTDVFGNLGISSATYYEHFPNKSNDYKEIDLLLRKNRKKITTNLLAKWVSSDNATLQIAAFKLAGDDDERKRLSQQYTDITSNGETIGATIVFEDKPEE